MHHWAGVRVLRLIRGVAVVLDCGVLCPGIGRRIASSHGMLHYSLVFLVIAIIAGVLGFAGIAGTAAGIAKILFFVFLVVWLITFLTGRKAV
jgi:uncharacterized membrane protein YtjA (UPF0391 family)